MNEYPSEEELNRIRNWNAITDARGLIDFVASVWNCDYGAYRTYAGHAFQLITGGWSGNESLIDALSDNRMFWSVYWKQSNRGGSYYFDDDMVSAELKSTTVR